MKILVTGASGFIGGHFIARYQGQQGLELHGLGRRSYAQIAAEHAARGLPVPMAKRYHAHDLSCPLKLDMRPDVVIHAAAMASPWGRAKAFERHNVEATRHVVEWCERNGRPRLLYISSSSVLYRRGDQLNLTEQAQAGPRFVNTYARTKYEGECIARCYSGQTVVLRPRAVFGPGDAVLFPRLLHAARLNRLALVTRPGEPVVGDLIYVDTLVDYLFRAAQAPAPADTYHLTNAQPVVLMDFLKDVFQRLNLSPPKRRVDYRLAWLAAAITEIGWRALPLRGEPPVTRFGIEVLAYSKTFDVSRTLTDFGPPSTTLNEGVAKFVTWQEARL